MIKQVITGLNIQVEITAYDMDAPCNAVGVPKVAGRPEKPIVFSRLESAIPEPFLEWVREQIGMKEE